jgi:hypothetical protein
MRYWKNSSETVTISLPTKGKMPFILHIKPDKSTCITYFAMANDKEDAVARLTLSASKLLSAIKRRIKDEKEWSYSRERTKKRAEDILKAVQMNKVEAEEVLCDEVISVAYWDYDL